MLFTTYTHYMKTSINAKPVVSMSSKRILVEIPKVDPSNTGNYLLPKQARALEVIRNKDNKAK
jgi:hypothetical protein